MLFVKLALKQGRVRKKRGARGWAGRREGDYSISLR